MICRWLGCNLNGNGKSNQFIKKLKSHPRRTNFMCDIGTQSYMCEGKDLGIVVQHIHFFQFHITGKV